MDSDSDLVSDAASLTDLLAGIGGSDSGNSQPEEEEEGPAASTAVQHESATGHSGDQTARALVEELATHEDTQTAAAELAASGGCPALPEGWQQVIDTNTNLPYYWNQTTDEVTWTPPEVSPATAPESPSNSAESPALSLQLPDGLDTPTSAASGRLKDNLASTAVVETDTYSAIPAAAAATVKPNTKGASEELAAKLNRMNERIKASRQTIVVDEVCAAAEEALPQTAEVDEVCAAAEEESSSSETSSTEQVATGSGSMQPLSHVIHQPGVLESKELVLRPPDLAAEKADQSEVGDASKPKDLSNLEEFVQLWRGRSTLSLQDYSLTSLEPLSLGSFALLTTLCLAGNHFTEVAELTSSLSNLKSLTELDISRCRLRQLPELQKLKHLRQIDASTNALSASSGLLYCTELQAVFLCHNQLRRVEQLETLRRLEELRVSHNRLGPTTLAAFRTVSACTQLRVLSVAGNPLASIKGHQVQLMNLMPSLELIDGRRMQTLRTRKRGSASNASGGVSGSRSSPSSPSRVGGCRRVRSGSTTAQNRQQKSASTITYGLLARMTPDRSRAPRCKPRYGSLTRSRAAHIVDSPRSPAWAGKMMWGSPVGKRPDGTPVRPARRCLSTGGLTPAGEPRGSSARRGLRFADEESDARTFPEPSQSTSLVRVESPARVAFSHLPSCEDAVSRDASRITESESQMEASTFDSSVEDVASRSRDAAFSKGELSSGPRVVSNTLDGLLEEKRRLLRRVSEHIGAARNSVGAELEASTISVEERQASEFASSPTGVRNSSAENPAKENVEATPGQGSPCLDLKSLRLTLRDGIERKRLLLEQLQCI